MEQMTVTAKIQISVATDDKVLLDETMSVYSDACNFVSEYIFRTHDLKQFSLNKVLYSALREKFGLKSQMAQSVFKTVIARYKTILENQKEWIKPSFKKPQYDLVWNRDYSLTQNCFSVNTLDGRAKLSNRNVLTIPNSARNSKCVRHHLQGVDSLLSVSEKTVGCRM